MSRSAHPTRRGVLAAAALSPFMARKVAAQPSGEPGNLSFPKGFRWGTATSAYQIEGAVNEGGRGPSIWDIFCKEPGRIRDGATGDVSCDHYHRYKEDVALMKSLGARAYRFSIAWPRVFPSGRGKLNPAGLAFYDRLVDEVLGQGIEPFATLYHWDLPQALQEKGGWERRDTALDFADYAGAVAAKLSDRVKNFFTLNEMASFIEHGYGIGVFAPGLKLPPDRLAQARHHAVLAHGLSVQAIRAKARPGTKVGPAENLTVALPAFEIPAHVKAAEIATRELNASYLTVMLEGRYTDAYLKGLGVDAPKVENGDLKIIGSPVDFIGLNVYIPGPYVIASDTAPGYQVLKLPKSYPHMASSWLTLAPEVLYWAPRHVARLWKPGDIYISENGSSSKDKPDKNGEVYDLDRVMYLRNCLSQLHRATSEGVPVRGYFLWSLLDNFEWADGYATRFGLVRVDYTTQKRTPKLSAAFYKEVIARNGVA